MTTKVTRYQTAEDFLAAAGELLYQLEARNSLMIGVVERLTDNPHAYGDQTPYLGLVTKDGVPLLAGTMTPPFGLLLTPFSEDAAEYTDLVISDLEKGTFATPDVSAIRPLAESFAAAWAAHTGGSYALEMAQRAHALHKVNRPAAVEGEFGLATPEDTELIADWLIAFELEALGGKARSRETALKAVADSIEHGKWALWRVDGIPVSMSIRTRPTRSGCSVAGVYTPPELRGSGYASNCVAALSQLLLDEGYQFTALYTDLANPTSNHIYAQIGYRPLADFDKYRLIR